MLIPEDNGTSMKTVVLKWTTIWTRSHDADSAKTIQDPDSYEDTDGCPDVDNDGDKVVDVADHVRWSRARMGDSGCPRTTRHYDGHRDPHFQQIHFAFNKT
jgi:hypothetical protein